MEYTNIEGVSIPVSRIILGASTKALFAGENQDELFDKAIESGVTAIDTARGYGGSEKVVGEYIKRRGLGDKILIQSKGGLHGVLGNNRVNERCVRKDLEISLKTLGVDKIDLYFLHRDNEKVPAGVLVELMNTLQKEGKIAQYAVSNWKASRIEEAIDYAKEHGLGAPVASQPQYSLPVVNRWTWIACESETGDKHIKSREWYAKTGFPLMAFSPLGNGYFSGRFVSSDPSTKKYLSGAAKGIYHCEENVKRLERAEKLAKELGVGVAEIGVSYILSGDMNTFVLAGASSLKTLASTVRGGELKLTKEQMEYLEGK